MIIIVYLIAEVNRRDYRAWYGLGQSYEVLKMPMYSLYYYKISQELRPFDSRMLVAIGETYETLERYENAIKCYTKACHVGDIEGITLLRLGNLYEKMGNMDCAIPAYIEFCKEERAIANKSKLCRAYITLGNYYESIGNYDEASQYAYKCLAYEEVKTEAQALLNTIRNKRNSNPMAVSTGPIVSSIPTTTSISTGTATNIHDSDLQMDESDIEPKDMESSERLSIFDDSE